MAGAYDGRELRQRSRFLPDAVVDRFEQIHYPPAREGRVSALSVLRSLTVLNLAGNADRRVAKNRGAQLREDKVIVDWSN